MMAAQTLLPRMDATSGRYGYVDERGCFVIAAKYDYAHRFDGEYAVVRSEGLCGFINREGEVVVAPLFPKVGGFSEGLFRVLDGSDHLWRFLNEEGLPAFEGKYLFVGDFHDGMAVYAVKDDAGQTCFGYLGRDGSVAVEAVYAYAFDFKDGYGKVVLDFAGEMPRYGFVGKDAAIVVPCVYSEEDAETQLNRERKLKDF